MKNNIISIFKLIGVVLRHKWFIIIAGRKLKVPIWRLITHDLSKFSWKELPHYARFFYGDKKDPRGWELAWQHHQNHNDHHWQYFTSPGGTFGKFKCIEMPEESIREMIADWQAASRSYNKEWPDLNNWKWLQDNWEKMEFHYITKGRIINIINELRKYKV